MKVIIAQTCPDCNCTIPQGRSIHYCRATKDFAVHYDGRLLGYRQSHLEADALLNEYVSDLFADGLVISLVETAAPMQRAA
jgi:hypothetical protein